MNPTSVFVDSIKVRLDVGPDMTDITGLLAKSLKTSGISDGLLAAGVVGSTGSLTTIEYEPGVVEDLKRAVERLAPQDEVYEHEKAWHDGNGHSHVQAALLGPSISVPVRGGPPSPWHLAAGRADQPRQPGPREGGRSDDCRHTQHPSLILPSFIHYKHRHRNRSLRFDP